jgi:hypothetical protein
MGDPRLGIVRQPGKDDVFDERRLYSSRLQPTQSDITAQDESGHEHDQPQ